MHSERLSYIPVTDADLGSFHRLARDSHVRRYLLDGTVVSLEWSAQRIEESQALFVRRGVGLCLAYERSVREHGHSRRLHQVTGIPRGDYGLTAVLSGGEH